MNEGMDGINHFYPGKARYSKEYGYGGNIFPLYMRYFGAR
jgi:hypothetical protein